MSTTRTDLILTAALDHWVFNEAPAIKAALNFLESIVGRQLTEAETREVLLGCDRHSSPHVPSLCSLLLQLSEGGEP